MHAERELSPKAHGSRLDTVLACDVRLCCAVLHSNMPKAAPPPNASPAAMALIPTNRLILAWNG
jgi:hypothetical protein